MKNRASYEDSHKREDKDVPGNSMPAGAKGAEKIMINKLVGQLKPPEFLHTLETSKIEGGRDNVERPFNDHTSNG